MLFKEHTYAVLLVSPAEKFNASLLELLPVSDYYPITVVKTATDARQALSGQGYDMVIINSPLADEFGSRFACDISASTAASVLIFVKNELYEDVQDKVMDYGVLAVSKPTSVQVVTQSLYTLSTMRERVRKMEEKQLSVEEKIQEIRLVNHAKWLLIECLSMSEQQAQKYIEKQAMDLRISKSAVAEKIIQTYK